MDNPEVIEGPSHDLDECIATAETHRRERYGNAGAQGWNNVLVVDSDDSLIWPVPADTDSD